ncbi:hypothetical protein NDU88_006429 [Pleurodeles waltl]|uniref:Uncharacterized protein n=1 Tax=Pleurodeles waltl TaxID=8319 RepID=A0AAV7MC72_PLEWA|nr:hypothetical protein NDU88_006429 [Pleurodeles waltl]
MTWRISEVVDEHLAYMLGAVLGSNQGAVSNAISNPPARAGGGQAPSAGIGGPWRRSRGKAALVTGSLPASEGGRDLYETPEQTLHASELGSLAAQRSKGPWRSLAEPGSTGNR